LGLCTAVFCNCGSSMELFEYLNQLYDSDDLHDYKYDKNHRLSKAMARHEDVARVLMVYAARGTA